MKINMTYGIGHARHFGVIKSRGQDVFLFGDKRPCLCVLSFVLRPRFADVVL